MTTEGKPCPLAPHGDSDFCYFHDPEVAAARAEGRKRGGKARHGRQIGSILPPPAPETMPKKLSTIEDVRQLLEWIAHDLQGLERSIARDRALTTLAQVAVQVIQVGSLEERLRALEETVRDAQHA